MLEVERRKLVPVYLDPDLVALLREAGGSLPDQIRQRLWFSFAVEATDGQLKVAAERHRMDARYLAAWTEVVSRETND